MYNKRYDRNDGDYHQHSTQYDNYMKSQEWQQKRAVRLWIDRNTCQMCGSSEHLEVHHVCSYSKLGHEDVYKDLICLCADCHKKVHRMMRRVTDPSGRRGWKEIKDS